MGEMSKRIRVEIKNLDTGEWRWLGWLDEDLLAQLTTYADDLNTELEERGTELDDCQNCDDNRSWHTGNSKQCSANKCVCLEYTAPTEDIITKGSL